MFKLQKVYMQKDGEMIMDILDTVDNSVDSVPAYFVEAFLDFDFDIEGVTMEDGELQLGRGIEIEYEKDEVDEEEFYSEDEEDEDYYFEDDEEDSDKGYSDGDDEDSMDEFYSDEEEEVDNYYEDDDDEYLGCDLDDEDINKNNMYDYFNPSVVEIVKDYYRWYTKNLYRDLASTIRLGVTIAKAEQLANIRNRGAMWEFTGIYDSGDMGCSCCTLGHEIRYEYHAQNEYGEDIIFGRDCVKDFFNLSDTQLRNLTKTQNSMTKEIMEIALKTAEGKVGLNSGEDLDFMYRVLFKLDENGELLNFLNKDLYKHLEKFIGNGIALPKSMVKEVRKQLSLDVLNRNVFIYDIGCTANNTTTKLLSGIFKDSVPNCDIILSDCKNKELLDTYKRFLAFAFKNKIDGCYAHSPLTGVCKEEGSCNKHRRTAWRRNENRLVYDLGFKDLGFEELKIFTEYMAKITETTNKLDSICSKYNRSAEYMAEDVYDWTWGRTQECKVDLKSLIVEDENGRETNIEQIILDNESELKYVVNTLYRVGNRYSISTDVSKNLSALSDERIELYTDIVTIVLDALGVSEEKEVSAKGKAIDGRYSVDSNMEFNCKVIISAYNDLEKREIFIRYKKSITAAIANTILKNGWFTNKQKRYIDEGMKFITEKGLGKNLEVKDTEVSNNKYVLSENPEILELVQRVDESSLDSEMLERIKALNPIIYNITTSALKHGVISEKQLKYVRLGDMEIDKILKEREGE